MAINPLLLNVKPISEITTVNNPTEGHLLFYDGSDELKKTNVSDFYNAMQSAYLGIATTTTTPPATGAYWYRVDTAGTYTNFLSGGSPIVVLEEDLTEKDVFLEVKDNVATKRVSLKNEKGISTHRKKYDDEVITEFFSFIDDIYIIDSEQEQNASAYAINYIWINTNVISQRVGKWGFQLMVNGSLNTNYGLPNATTADIINGRLIEIKADTENEPLANRIKVFVKFKSFPTGTIFLQRTFSPFYNQAFIINDFSLLVDLYRPTNTINKAFTEDNKGL